MERKTKLIKTNEEFKIFADPYRMKILDLYGETRKPMTVKMVADELGEVPAKVHYHIKKLISIGVLELDHVEVINGINAKYYKLVYDNFTIDIDDDASPKIKALQVDNITKLLFKKIDGFKDVVRKQAEKVKTELDHHDEKDGGFLSVNNVYLTFEEQEELRDLITEYLQKHSKEGKDKIKYSIINGIMKNE